jgi:chemotaxis protein MotB
MILDDGLKASDHVEEDENYFISMTDMMVGVLFIFLIMLMLFALNFRNITEDQIAKYKRDSEQLKLEQEQLKTTKEQLRRVSRVADQVAGKLDDLRDEVSGDLAAMVRANQVRSELLNKLRDELRGEGLDVQIDEANGVLRLTESAIRFPVNRSDLVGPATTNVDKVASALTSCRRSYPGAPCEPLRGSATVETVFIEGHTDSTGGDDKNWPLSTERAVTTYQEMTTFSPELRSLENSRGNEILSVSGYASTRPIDPEGTKDAYAKNRRIDLRFVMEDDSKQRLQAILAVTERMKGELDRLHTAVGEVK